MKISKNKKKIVIIFILAIISIISILTRVAIGATQSTIYQVGMPRTNQSTAWGATARSLMNGWKIPEEEHSYTVRAVGGYEGKVAYCIEPRSRLIRPSLTNSKRRGLLG